MFADIADDVIISLITYMDFGIGIKHVGDEELIIGCLKSSDSTKA